MAAFVGESAVGQIDEFSHPGDIERDLVVGGPSAGQLRQQADKQRQAAATYGPGHNGFFRSPDGTEDWIVYHGKETDEYTYAGRSTRAQKIAWRADGTPDFGRPVPRGVPLAVPSGERP